MAVSARERPVISSLVEVIEERLSARGRFLVVALILFATLGLDTRRTQNFRVFALAAGVFVAASLFAFVRRPRAALDCTLPERATAGRTLAIEARVTAAGDAIEDDLLLSFPMARRWSSSVPVEPRQQRVIALPGTPAVVHATLRPARRGRYRLRPPVLRGTDPLGLVAGRAREEGERHLLVYPRFFTFGELKLPVGRRYQPGGIPMSSSTGDAQEFVGTRDYREGDPIKNIHWRSFGRRGKPVVREFQEEYFCRIALVLDTSTPKRPTAADEARFEAAISVLASIADQFSRGDFVVDLLAAGPDLYYVSAGRSLGSLETVLDVLAALEPSPAAPFATVGPPLIDALAQISTVVAVLQDWDESRENFLREVKALGTEVRAFVVREGAPTRPLPGAELFEVSPLRPAEIDERIALEERARA
ncbi:MAG: DUF58 domain-containing protein [Vicinamibacteria bacterium]|nr:DUF58 domain-containing protein [Vicinamibacteria bacterium]